MTTRFLTRVSIVILVCARVASADSWQPPSPSAVTSPHGTYLARIEPGRRTSADDPAKKSNAIIYRFNHATRDYERIKELPLVNSTLPVNAVIRDDGKYLVTFDDYASTGVGNNVIVIYDLATDTRVNLGLGDFLTETQIEELPESSHSRRWRGLVNLMLDQRYVFIAPAGDLPGQDSKSLSFTLDLEDKKVRIDARK